MDAGPTDRLFFAVYPGAAAVEEISRFALMLKAELGLRADIPCAVQNSNIFRSE